MKWTMYRLAGGVLLLVSAFACESGGSAGPSPVPEFVVIRPSQEAILTNDTVQLTVTGRGGAPIAATELGWSSSAPEVAAVIASGQVIALAPGTATITGVHGTASGKAYVSVTRGSGRRVPEMASFDSIIPRIMNRWSIPGGAVAVVKDGRLVLARGYGWADQGTGKVIQPDALFRVASLSKPITAVAVLKLHEEGRLDLDMGAFSVLPHLQPPAGETEDPRLARITVRQLLHHSGGWDRDATFDPMFRSRIVAQSVGSSAPASAEAVIRYMRGQPLQFDPGSGYSYSNFGYAVLGRNIERVTGESYEDYVRTNVLAPMGISRMRIGSTPPSERAEGEVHYYDSAMAESVFPGGGVVPVADGGFYLEAMDAHGGWIASVVDLLRFVTSVDRLETRPDFLSASTIDLMIARPAPPLWVGSSYHYAMGWLIRPLGGEANWWHDGSLPGTTALLVRAHNGLAWAALFNARAGTSGGSFAFDLDGAMWQAVEAVSSWPAHDWFTQYK